MIHRIPITKARVNLGAVVRRVHNNKEYFILEKDGIPEELLAGKSRPMDEFLAARAASRTRKLGQVKKRRRRS